MPSSYNLPELVKKEIDALVKSGYYSSKSDVVKDALRYMLESKKNLRLAAVIHLYKTGEVSLGTLAVSSDTSNAIFTGAGVTAATSSALAIVATHGGASASSSAIVTVSPV